MKVKIQHQMQPREIVALRHEQVEEEIQNFLLAVDSYPNRVVKEPGVTFQQHLSSFFASASRDRRDIPSRRQ